MRTHTHTHTHTDLLVFRWWIDQAVLDHVDDRLELVVLRTQVRQRSSFPGRFMRLALEALDLGINVGQTAMSVSHPLLDLHVSQCCPLLGLGDLIRTLFDIRVHAVHLPR